MTSMEQTREESQREKNIHINLQTKRGEIEATLEKRKL